MTSQRKRQQTMLANIATPDSRFAASGLRRGLCQQRPPAAAELDSVVRRNDDAVEQNSPTHPARLLREAGRRGQQSRPHGKNHSLPQ
ncbi:hypothetical protein HNQ50_000487 [Silvimonas terrae]|uniref:Uncharacterized protein n=1 Tax=Silvimonas terrae TaxID=300266 RepID=A0A840RA39_9NEIS|nr:hypothetical protein [Silvimonas terrae]MBB5189777.1 hypothetical protein [Silvimonas terrae]